MSAVVSTGNNTGLADGTKIAADVVGAAAAPSAGDEIQYVKLDVGAAGASSPVTAANPMPIGGTVAVNNLPASQPVTVVDGGDVAQGSKGDAAWDGAAASTTGMSIWKYLGAKLEAVRALLAGTLTTTVSNFPATQAVTGTVTVIDSVPLSVSGTVGVSNFPATQPVSAAALPLPAGASTSALQTTGNTSVASIDTKIPAQGQALAAASMPVVLPAAQITALTPPTSVGVNNFPATQPVSAAALPLPAGAATSALQTTANTSLANFDVAMSTRLKPADTLAGVTTVGAVTAITNALPAGTNAIGKVSVSMLNRVPMNIFAEAVAGAAAEALVTLSTSLNNAAVATGTSYSPTAGKNFRATAIVISFVSTTTTANTTRIRLRVNAGGAAIVTSPIQFSARVGWPSATFIANEVQTVVIPLGEGFDVPSGAGLAVTHIEAAANGTIDISILGFEYTP